MGHTTVITAGTLGIGAVFTVSLVKIITKTVTAEAAVIAVSLCLRFMH